MLKSELQDTINATLYIVYRHNGISLSRLRTYLKYFNYLNIIKYPDELDQVFFKKLFNSKYITYINRRNNNLELASGIYINDGEQVDFSSVKTDEIDRVMNKLKRVPYIELVEKTTAYTVVQESLC